MQLKVDQVELDLVAGYATKAGEKINIRAKTLKVLQHLIDHNTEIVTKDMLLTAIWSDVVVQEQVLVQSIKEIRAIFGTNAIKTYPKQGYQWVAQFDTVADVNNKRYRLLAATLTILMLCGITLWFFLQKPKEPVLTLGFLPVENSIPDVAHDWVPSKGSEQLRQLMASYQHVDVVPQAQLDTFRQQANVDVLVYTRLAGYPKDFQLDYTLYLPHGTERGVEFGQDIQQLFSQFTQKLAKRFNMTNSVTKNINSSFSQEALSRGIELYLNREYQSAQVFFASALHDNAEQLTARRFLAACKVNLDDQPQAILLLMDNIRLAKALQNHKEQIRSQLMLAALYINQKSGIDFQQAEHHLRQVITLAKQHNVPMFTAYAYEELAKMQRLNGFYTDAKNSLNNALTFHQTINDNYSQTTALIELAFVAAAQGEYNVASQYLIQAQEIADQHGAVKNQVAILMARAKLAKDNDEIIHAKQIAEQAKSLAKKADNQLLIARINAWLENRYYYEIH